MIKKSSPIIITPQQAASVLQAGEIIAYPTEAVYGLGCDPFNEQAVKNLLALKQRDISKGLILIAASWYDVEFLVDKKTVSIDLWQEILSRALSTWPGPVTWLFPASSAVPEWIKGKHNSVALRVTAHPTAKAICQAFGGAIVSTSANLTNLPPARTRRELLCQFCQLELGGPEAPKLEASEKSQEQKKLKVLKKLKFIVSGRVGHLKNPTPIYDVLTGKVLRAMSF